MSRSVALCIFLLILIEAVHTTPQRSRGGRPSRDPAYMVGRIDDEEEYSEVDDEELEELPEIDEEGLPHGASLVNEDDPPYKVGLPKQVDRNKPKRKGFDYEARKTTPFRYVDTTAEKRPKRGSGKKSDDESETVEDDDDEDASEEKENESGSKDDDDDDDGDKKKSSNKGKAKEKKGKSKKKSDEEDKDEEDYSDSTLGVLSAKNHLMLWIAVSLWAWKLLFGTSV